MKQKYIEAHMKAAEVYSELSSAIRLKVGCVVVKDNTIIGIGYNGMPAGWTNECEYKEYPDRYDKHSEWADLYYPLQEPNGTYYKLKTKPEVLHAETNAIAKIARSTNSSDGASLFVTHAPCLDCAKIIHQAGINSVYYRNTYRTTEGLDFLDKCGIHVEKV
jgi:dCMP deaminase